MKLYSGKDHVLQVPQNSPAIVDKLPAATVGLMLVKAHKEAKSEDDVWRAVVQLFVARDMQADVIAARKAAQEELKESYIALATVSKFK